MDALESLTKTPKLESGEYGDLVKALNKVNTDMDKACRVRIGHMGQLLDSS